MRNIFNHFESSKCTKCGYKIDNISHFGWWAEDVRLNGGHGCFCSGKMGKKPSKKQFKGDINDPKNLHSPETKESRIRKILEKLDRSKSPSQD